MRELMLLILTFYFLGCGKQPVVKEPAPLIDSTHTTFYIDRDESSIVINNDGDSTKCYGIKAIDYEIVQIAPEQEWINFIAKRTTSTATCDGQEGQKRTIKIELNPVDHPSYSQYVIQHDCDELMLEHDYYHTVFNGCCDAEPIHKIYDYGGNLLLEGNVKVLIGAIPNNPLKFFIGYKPYDDDSLSLGTVSLVYDKDNKYEIKIMSPPLPPDLCSFYSPQMELVSMRYRDTLDVFEDEYQLWDLESIESEIEIRNIAISLVYQCEEYYPVDPIVIPVTRGMPFGKNERFQEVNLIHKVESPGYLSSSVIP